MLITLYMETIIFPVWYLAIYLIKMGGPSYRPSILALAQGCLALLTSGLGTFCLLFFVESDCTLTDKQDSQKIEQNKRVCTT